MPEDSFDLLMTRLRQGDDQAAAEVFHRFAHRLLGLARQRLDAVLRRKVDAEDVVQSAFGSFFLHHAREEFDLGNWDGLWGLLTTITVRKCARKKRFFRQERRDIRREADVAPNRDSSFGPGLEFKDLEPTPEQAAELVELIEQVMRKHQERDRHILVLALQGHTTAEVSEQVGCTQRTVQRVLCRLSQWLRRLDQDEVRPD